MVDIFPLPYFGPVDWYALYLRSSNPLIELFDTIPRQSIHSRCLIDGPQNPIKLSIPVMEKGKIPTVEAKISYRERWPDMHLQAMRTSYNSSPFFPLIEHEISDLLFKKFTYLADLNQAIHELMIKLLRVDRPIQYTKKWATSYAGNDYRQWPKNQTHPAAPKIEYPSHYTNDGHAFSILDLIASEGSWAYETLTRSVE
ncbi:MAG: WbqC family protein [Cryomorphaceae bacterium]|nr:WbqC family protein [Cryomorphaceae bacterium]